jgi:hypothetical protein
MLALVLVVVIVGLAIISVYFNYSIFDVLVQDGTTNSIGEVLSPR